MNPDIKIISNEEEAYFLFLRKLGFMKNELIDNWWHHWGPEEERDGKRKDYAIRFTNWLFIDENIFVPNKLFEKTLDRLEKKEIIKRLDYINVIEELERYPIDIDKNGKPIQTDIEYIISEHKKYPNIPPNEVVFWLNYEIKKIDEKNEIIKQEIKNLKDLGFEEPGLSNKKLKISFQDGYLINNNTQKKIHRFSERAMAYTLCDFFFNKSKHNEWLDWQEIGVYITKLEWGEISNDFKQKIYDSIRLINNHVFKITRQNIIKNDGMNRYKLEF